MDKAYRWLVRGPAEDPPELRPFDDVVAAPKARPPRLSTRGPPRPDPDTPIAMDHRTKEIAVQLAAEETDSDVDNCFVEGTNIIHDILDMIPQRRALTPAVPQERHPRLARKRRRDSSFLKDFQNRSARVETGRGLVSVDEKVRRIKRELGLTADEYVPALDALSSMASSSSESTGISQEQRHHAPSLRRRRRRRAARKNPRARTEPVLYLSPGSEAKKSGIAPIDLDLVEGLPSSDASEMAKGYSCNPFSGLASPYRPRTATNETSPINLVDHDEQLLFPVLSEIRVPDLTHSPVPLFVNPYSTVEPAPVQMRSRSKKGQPIPEVIKPAQTTFSLDPFFPMDESEDHVVGVLSGISPVPIPPATSSRTRGPDPPVLSADFSVDPIPLDHGFADGDASTVGLIEQTIETVLVEASVERLDIFHYGDREGIVFAPMRCVDQESDQNEQYLSRWWDRLCREDEGAPAEKTDLSGGDPFLLNCCWFCPVSNPANVATTTDVRVVPSPVSEVLVFPDADGMSRITSEDEFEVEVGDGAIVVSGGNDVRYLGTLVHRLDNTVHTDHFDLLVEVSDGHKAEMTDDVDLATRSTQTSILASPVVDEPCRHAHQQVKPCSWGFFLVPVFSFSPCAVLHSRRDAVGEDIDVSNVDADQIVDVARKVPHQCVFPEPIPCQLQPSTRALYLVDSSSDEAEPHQPNELSLSPAAVCSSDSTVKLDNRASATLATTLLPEYMSHSIIPRSTTDMEFGKPPRSFQEEGLSEGDEELLSVDDIAHVVGESIHISSTGSEAEVAFDEAVSPDATMGTKKELSDPVQASFISFQPLYPELPELRDEVSSVNKEADDANTSSSRTTTCSGAAISPSAIVTRDQPTCEMEEHEDSRTAVDSPVVSMAATQSRVERVQCQVSESAVPGFTPAELDCIEKPGVTSVGLDTSDSAGDPVGSSFLRPIDLISEEGFMHGEREYIMVAGRREPSESEAGLCSEQATAPQTHVRRTSSSIISPGYQSTRVDGLPRKHHRTTTFVQPTGSSRCTFENYEPSVVNDDRSDVVGAVGHEKDEQRDDSHGSSDVLLQGGRRRTPCGRDRLDALRKDMEFARRTLNRRLATLHVHSEPQSEAAVEQDIVRRAQKLADQSSVLFFKPVINFYQGTPPLMEALPTPVASSSQRLSPVEDVGVNETDEVINVSSDLENDVLQKLERRDNYVEAVAEQRRQPCVCTSPRPDLIPLASGQLLPTGSVVSARAAVDTSRIGESDGRIEGTCRSFESVPVIEDTATQSDCDVVELDESTLACDEDFHIDPSLAEKFAEIEEALDSTAISLDAPDQDESFDDDLANELDALEAAETSLKRDLDLLHLKRESLLYVSQRSRSQGGADMNTRTPLMSESTVAFPLSGPVLESQSEVLSPRTSQTPSAYDPTVVDNMEASLKYPIADPKVESSNSRQRDVVELRSPSSTEMDTDTDISIYSEHVRMAPVPEKHTGEVDAFLPRGRMRFDSMSSDSGSRDSDVIVLGDGWRDAVELYLRSSYDDDSVESEEIEIIFVEDSFMSTESFSYGELKGVVFDWIRIQDAVVSSLFEVDSDAVSKRGEQTTLRPRDEEETHSQCVWRSQLPGDVLDPRVPVTLVIRDTGAEDKQTVESRPLIQSQRQQVVDLGCFKGAVDDAIDRDLGHQSRAALCENRVQHLFLSDRLVEERWSGPSEDPSSLPTIGILSDINRKTRAALIEGQCSPVTEEHKSAQSKSVILDLPSLPVDEACPSLPTVDDAWRGGYREQGIVSKEACDMTRGSAIEPPGIVATAHPPGFVDHTMTDERRELLKQRLVESLSRRRQEKELDQNESETIRVEAPPNALDSIGTAAEFLGRDLKRPLFTIREDRCFSRTPSPPSSGSSEYFTDDDSSSALKSASEMSIGSDSAEVETSTTGSGEPHREDSSGRPMHLCNTDRMPEKIAVSILSSPNSRRVEDLISRSRRVLEKRHLGTGVTSPLMAPRVNCSDERENEGVSSPGGVAEFPTSLELDKSAMMADLDETPLTPSTTMYSVDEMIRNPSILRSNAKFLSPKLTEAQNRIRKSREEALHESSTERAKKVREAVDRLRERLQRVQGTST